MSKLRDSQALVIRLYDIIATYDDRMKGATFGERVTARESLAHEVLDAVDRHLAQGGPAIDPKVYCGNAEHFGGAHWLSDTCVKARYAVPGYPQLAPAAPPDSREPVTTCEHPPSFHSPLGCMSRRCECGSKDGDTCGASSPGGPPTAGDGK